jgi:hypothetical protein
VLESVDIANVAFVEAIASCDEPTSLEGVVECGMMIVDADEGALFYPAQPF